MDSKLSATSLVRIALAAAFAAAPAPALAQSIPTALSSVSIAKGEAILGGAPSRLAAILAEQGQPISSAKPLQPAAFRSPAPFQSAVARTVEAAIADTGRPDVFGTVALSIGRSPFDQRWRQVLRQRVGGSTARFARALQDSEEVARLEAVNRFVNSRVEFTDDSRLYRRGDHWSPASETLRRGRGDCEDYAIAKLQMLREAGFADEDLYLVVLKDLVRRNDHAVLVVRSGGRLLMLDNGTDVIADTHQVSDYRPMLTLSASGAWTHGYKRSKPAITVAAAEEPIQVASVELPPPLLSAAALSTLNALEAPRF